MSHSITLQVNPESLNFLNQYKKKHLSFSQQAFSEIVKRTYQNLSELKKQTCFQFTANNEFELSRGDFYAITESLLKKFPEEKISLENLHAALENDLHINNKETLSFITLCLVEPVWLPGSLSGMACAILSSSSYICSNQNLSNSFKAVIGADNKHLVFQLNLDINAFTTEELLPRGIVTLYFTIDNLRQVKLLPIHMHFDFRDEKESEEFQQKLAKDFKTWLLHQNELTKIHAKLRQMPIIHSELCILPILLGLFISLIAMISFIALGLSLHLMLIVPPLGLALGLILASLANSYVYLDKKKEEKKLQRPIYLFNKKQLTHPQTQAMPATSFFVHTRLNPTVVENRLTPQP